MSPESARKFKDIVEGLISEIRAAVAAGEDHVRPVAPDNAIGRLTRLEAIQSQQMGTDFLRRQEVRLGFLEQALERLYADRYGICMRCGRDIPEARLEAKPETRLCVPCTRV